MREGEFWALIEASLVGGDRDCTTQAAYLRRALAQRGREACIGFYRQLRRYMETLHTFDVFAASLLIHHAAAPDLFRHFRAWLVCRGQARYRAAMQDVSAIAAFLEYKDVDELDGRPLLDAPLEAFIELGGFEDEFLSAVGNHPEPHFEQDWPQSWTALSRRWPVLYEKFCRQP